MTGNSFNQSWGVLRLSEVGIALGLLLTAGCGGSVRSPSAEPPTERVFVDVKSGEVVIGSVLERVPAVNPATGESTLMPGMYCAQCGKWYPLPPVEVVNRQPGAGLCPVHRTPLHAEGPWPEWEGQR